MGSSKDTFLATRPLPTGRLWFALGAAWFTALGAVRLDQQFVALLLATGGLALVATLGLAPIRRAFRREQNKIAALLNAAPEGVLEVDARGAIVFVNPQLCAIFGYTAAELLGQSIEMLVPPASRHAHATQRRQFQDAAQSRSMGSGLEISGVRKDGSRVYLDISLNRVQTPRGTAMYCMVRDDSVRKSFEQQLLKSNQCLLESVATLERNAFELRLLSGMGEALHGSASEAQLFGIVTGTMERLFPERSGALYLLEQGADAVAACRWGPAAAALPARVPRTQCWSLDGLCVALQGHGELLGVLYLADDAASQGAPQSAGAAQLPQALANQIALSLANLRLREKLRAQSTIDPLTGLKNRRVLNEGFEVAISTAFEQRRDAAVLVLDIDHFKSFNDRFGHECGDIALREVGALLRRLLRHHDFVCRTGGEEFAVLLPDTTLQEAATVAEKLRHAVESLRLHAADRILPRISVSIGLAALGPHGQTAAALMRNADRALYRAKAGGRNQVAIGGPDDADERPLTLHCRLADSHTRDG